MERKWLKKAILILVLAPLIPTFLFTDGPYESPFAQFFFAHSRLIVLLYALIWLTIACVDFPKMNEACVGFALLFAFLLLLYKLSRGTLIDSVDSIIENSTLFLLMATCAVHITSGKFKE